MAGDTEKNHNILQMRAVMDLWDEGSNCVPRGNMTSIMYVYLVTDGFTEIARILIFSFSHKTMLN